MTQEKLEQRLKEIFEENYEYIRLEGGVPFTPEVKDRAWQQVLWYLRKLRSIADKVTETEVRLTLPNCQSPEKRRYSIEGVVDIVQEEKEVWMYDVKTHEADYIRANKELYGEQLNVYSHIWEKIRGNRLDHTAVISTVLPASLRDALASGDEARQNAELNRWEPVIELNRNTDRVKATIEAFGKVVDFIETKTFTPPPVRKLEEKIEGTNTKFATMICRNCDARFSCPSFREYARKGHIRGKFDFSRYLNDLADPLEHEEWLSGNLESQTTNETSTNPE